RSPKDPQAQFQSRRGRRLGAAPAAIPSIPQLLVFEPRRGTNDTASFSTIRRNFIDANANGRGTKVPTRIDRNVRRRVHLTFRPHLVAYGVKRHGAACELEGLSAAFSRFLPGRALS